LVGAEIVAGMSQLPACSRTNLAGARRNRTDPLTDYRHRRSLESALARAAHPQRQQPRRSPGHMRGLGIAQHQRRDDPIKLPRRAASVDHLQHQPQHPGHRNPRCPASGRPAATANGATPVSSTAVTAAPSATVAPQCGHSTTDGCGCGIAGSYGFAGSGGLPAAGSARARSGDVLSVLRGCAARSSRLPTTMCSRIASNRSGMRSSGSLCNRVSNSRGPGDDFVDALAHDLRTLQATDHPTKGSLRS
jgi:hypothetical protein